MVSMEVSTDPISTAIEKVPGIIDKVSGFVRKKKGKDVPAEDAGVVLND
jgi:hypothetical protein